MPAPRKHSKRYKEVVAAGCGGWRDYWGDYDCHHDYDWTCDDCPWRLRLEELRDKAFVGPPDPDYYAFVAHSE